MGTVVDLVETILRHRRMTARRKAKQESARSERTGTSIKLVFDLLVELRTQYRQQKEYDEEKRLAREEQRKLHVVRSTPPSPAG